LLVKQIQSDHKSIKKTAPADHAVEFMLSQRDKIQILNDP